MLCVVFGVVVWGWLVIVRAWLFLLVMTIHNSVTKDTVIYGIKKKASTLYRWTVGGCMLMLKLTIDMFYNSILFSISKSVQIVFLKNKEGSSSSGTTSLGQRQRHSIGWEWYNIIAYCSWAQLWPAVCEPWAKETAGTEIKLVEWDLSTFQGRGSRRGLGAVGCIC